MPLDMPSNPSEFSKSERKTALFVILLNVTEYRKTVFWNNPSYFLLHSRFHFRIKRRIMMRKLYWEMFLLIQQLAEKLGKYWYENE